MRPAINLLLLSALLHAASAQPSEPVPATVSASWLAEHQSDPDLVILHVAFNRRDYLREHIPGARFIWFSWLSPSTPDGSTEMASIDDARRILEDLGVGDRSKLVVYFTGSTITTTTRTIFSLLYFGFDGRVTLLDGGLEAWKRSGGAVTKEVPSIQRTPLRISVHSDLLADAEYVRTHLSDPAVTIVDARSKNFYEGSGGGSRPGHVKGAVSLPFSSLADSLNQMKDLQQLASLFEQAGVRKGSTVVAYCHVGQQATVVLHAARMLGYRVRLYDGSYEEWSALNDDQFPVETVVPSSDH